MTLANVRVRHIYSCYYIIGREIRKIVVILIEGPISGEILEKLSIYPS